MAKSTKTIEAQVCESAISGLEDVIADLRIIAKGRGTQSRFNTITDTLFKVKDAIWSIDPMMSKIVGDSKSANEEKPAAKVKEITHDQGLLGYES